MDIIYTCFLVSLDDCFVAITNYEYFSSLNKCKLTYVNKSVDIYMLRINNSNLRRRNVQSMYGIGLLCYILQDIQVVHILRPKRRLL